jgi:hypothetical protein
MFKFSLIRAPILAAVPALALLTSGCSLYSAHVCEHDYGLSKGTSDFSNCMAFEKVLNLRRAAILSQIGDDLRTSQPAPMAPMPVQYPNPPPIIQPPPQPLYCQGQSSGFGQFTATCH